MTKMLVYAALAMALPLAYATDLPPLKEGLWSVHNQTISSPGNKKNESTYSLCRDHAFDVQTQALGKSVKGCTITKESLIAGKYSAETHCQFGKVVIDTKGTTAYQGETSMHSEGHTTYTPAYNGMTETTMIVDQKYVGACPLDLQPGDRKGPDGKVIHPGQR